MIFFPEKRSVWCANVLLLAIFGWSFSSVMAGESVWVCGKLHDSPDEHVQSGKACNPVQPDADFQERVEFTRLAAFRGDARAMLWLGVIFDLGLSVERDLDKALFWYVKAAEKEYWKGYLPLAFAYAEKGDDGKARFWFDKACETYRYGNGESELLMVFGAGYIGDYMSLGQRERRRRINRKRLRWLEGFARDAHPRAAAMMASVYRMGIGVTKDAGRGDAWCHKAKVVDADGYVVEQYCY